jgi:hypothetical protein
MDRLRPLAADNPAHQPALVQALDNLGVRLDRVGRSAEGLAARTEAVQVYRDLAAADPVFTGIYISSGSGLSGKSLTGKACTTKR